MYLCTRNYDLKRGGTFETAKAGTFHSVTAGTSIPLFTQEILFSDIYIQFCFDLHKRIIGRSKLFTQK